MLRKTARKLKTDTKRKPASSSRYIATLRLSQAHGKRLAEMLLDKNEQGGVYALINSEGTGDEDRTTTITVLGASKVEDCGLDPKDGTDVGEIRGL